MSVEDINLAPLSHHKPDRFRVTLILPSSLLRKVSSFFEMRDGKLVPDAFTINSKEVNIPDFEIPSIAVPFAGGQGTVSSHSRVKEGELTFMFDLDEQWLGYGAIYGWMDAMCDDIDGLFNSKKLLGETPNDGKLENVMYTGKITVEVFSIGEKVVGIYTFDDVFPVKLKSPRVDYRIDGIDRSMSEASFNFKRFHFRPVFSA